MKADVYRNLHTGLWSVRNRSTGLVAGHAPVVYSALPVTFPVRPAGHRRALQEGVKNVHAFVRGDWLTASDEVDKWQALVDSLILVPVSYNPFRGPSFYRKDTGEDVSEAQTIVMIAAKGAPPYVGALF